MKSEYNFDSSFGFSEVHNDRIGQLINYLALKIPYLYCTKLIKLLYIIDEESMLKLGVPITWMKYKVYKMGPVPEDLWISIKDGNSVFGEYFDVNEVKGDFGPDEGINYRISAISKEEMSDFSKKELSIVDSVIDSYGGKTPDQLIEYLHKDSSLWYKIVEKNKISFDKKLATTHIIDLTQLIDHDKYKLQIYHDAQEEIDLLESLL